MTQRNPVRAGIRGTVTVLATMLVGMVLVWVMPAPPGARGIAGYLPVHTVLETASIAIAVLVFAVSWSLRGTDLPGASLLVGSAFLFVAVTDLTHALSFDGMPDLVTPSGPEKAINFWLAARIVAALALLAVVVLPWRPFATRWARYGPLAGFLALAVVVHAVLLLRPDAVPRTFVEGTGLTTFKVTMEYLIVATNVVTALILVRRMRRSPTYNASALLGAVCAMAMSELLFTLYADVTDVFNLLGHVYKVISYLFLYRAIFASSIELPYAELQASRGKLQGTLDALPDLLFEIDTEGRVYDVNEPCATMLGIRPEALATTTVHHHLGRGAADVLVAALAEARERGVSRGGQYQLQSVQGPRWYEIAVARKGAESDPDPHYVVLSHDIAVRKAAEHEAQRLANLYAALSKCNEAIVRAGSTADLLPVICHDVVELGGMSMAWIRLETCAEGALLVASSRVGDVVDDGVPPTLETAIAGAPYPPATRAMQDDEPVWCQDFMADPVTGTWHEHGERLGWGASASLPLHRDGAVVGNFTLFADEIAAFDERARNLLIEMSMDIDFAMHNFERDRRRRQAEAELADSRNLLKTVIDTVPVRIFWKDGDLRYSGCNLPFARDAGLASPDDVVGMDDDGLTWHSQAEQYRADDLQVLATGRPRLSYEEPQTRSDGSTVWLSMSKVPLLDASGSPLGVLGVYEDISVRREAELAVRRSEAELNVAQSIAQVGSWRYDVGSARIEASRECSRMFGIAPSDLSVAAALAAVHPKDRDAVVRDVRTGTTFETEFRIVVDEHVRWISARVKVQTDAEGRAVAFVGTTQDVTARKVFEDRVYYLAHFDTLTGLPNRTQLDDLLAYVLSRAQGGERVALMFIDLDRFKDVNDSLGHSVGDALLVQLAGRLRGVLRDEDVVSRLGGDEFIVMAPHTDRRRAAVVAQKLLDVIAEPYAVDNFDLHLTASIGIALYPRDGTVLESLSKSADIAMYRAKQDGRNCFRFFTAAMQERSVRNLQIVNDLRHALERGQLHLVYQPQIAIQDGRLIGVEALLRWEHPQLGSVPPAEFIPIAEDSGLIMHIGEWVIRRAVAQLRSWLDAGLPSFVVAVNLSAVQFRHANLPETIDRILTEEGLPPDLLELELTEGVAMHDPRTAIGLMRTLHERGIRIALDDFGTGYSSLSYLKEFTVYKLKIDKSFVHDISFRPENRAIVATIVSIARSLDLKTIAEGVETGDQFAFLRAQGCDEVQGFYFSRPLLPDALAAYARGSGPWTGIVEGSPGLAADQPPAAHSD